MSIFDKPLVDAASGTIPVDSSRSIPPGDSELDDIPIEELKISGFDRGVPVFFKEPSFYLAVAAIFVATLNFSKTASAFWITLLGLIALTVGFFVVAERVLLKDKTGFDKPAVPFDGVFVLTFGAIIPGLSLVSYAIYALFALKSTNPWAEIGKIALLLVVPFFNFAVWSSIRRKYLARPRLTGLMNGLALGLSATWSAIWMCTVMFGHANTAMKFGWVLLLFSSPFMFFASLCLGLDLWRKTEASIKRITASFSIMGALLSLMFVLLPVGRALSVQSLILETKQSSGSEQVKHLAKLRANATKEELCPSKFPLSGFDLAASLVPDRGLSPSSESDCALYFQVTGKPMESKPVSASSDISSLVEQTIAGLSLCKSQIAGTIDSQTLSSSMDWTLTFRNMTYDGQEACGEIQLPKGAVVSRATLWINGDPQDGAFGPSAQVSEAYRAVANRNRDPLLVTMPAPDRILFQCSPVPARGGEMRIRLGFKLPLETADGVSCEMQLPRFVGTNFSQTMRNRVYFSSDEPMTNNIAGVTVQKATRGYTLSGLLRTSDKNAELGRIALKRTSQLREIVTPDWNAPIAQFIEQRLLEVRTNSPKHFAVVIDSSASLKEHVSEIKNALSSLPASTSVYFAPEGALAGSEGVSIERAQAAIKENQFVGGQDNFPVVKQALESAAENSRAAVIWIHGPQPFAQISQQWSSLDLLNPVCLYDVPIEVADASTIQAFANNDLSVVPCSANSQKSVGAVLKQLASGWRNGTEKLQIERRMITSRPPSGLITDPSTSARITCLWAREEVSRLLASGRLRQAENLASRYRILSSVNGIVIVDNPKDYASRHLKPGAFRDARTSDPPPSIGGAKSSWGLVGAPVDPRYGQSNEVGMMADFGYDTARDIARLATALSLIISGLVATLMIRAKKEKKNGALITKAAGLVVTVPLIVHFVGTYIINNFGGLGGGL